MSGRRRLITITAVLTLLACLVAPAQRAHAATSGTTLITIGTTPVDVTFNAPAKSADPIYHDDDPEDTAQLQHLAQLINDAPAGSTIQAALYSLTATEIYDPIKQALARGVKIQAIYNGHPTAPSMAVDLHNLLGDANHHWCDHGSTTEAYGKACISTDSSSLMHAKYWLFSQTKDSAGTSHANVTWISSANETHSSGTRLFNNALTFYDDKALYDQTASKLWTPMWNEDSYTNNDFYVASTGRGTYTSDASDSKVYASPEQTTDLVLNRLNEIAPGSDCQIRLMEMTIHDTRKAVLDKLVALKQGGCSVSVVRSSIDDASLAELRNAGIPVRQREIHDKVILIHARYNGSTDPRPIVLTGSHNLTASALKINDEILLKVSDSETLYNLYVDHFNDAFSTGV